MQLNEEQLKVVSHPPGHPAILLASAGSGKTSVLTNRIVWLIEHAQVEPKRILALTFTNKAANEMRTRVLSALPHLEEVQAPRLTTIHSLALSMIRRNPPAFGLPPKISPIDDYDQSQIMKAIIAREKWEDINPWKVLEQIEFHRARGVGFVCEYTESVHEEAKRVFNGYHALRPMDIEAWKLFEEAKQNSGVTDFSDMLHLCIRRHKTDEKWREALWKVYHHVLIDEAQDSSPVVWSFCNALLGPDNPNIMIIGDEKQSIYSFLGAYPKLIQDCVHDWRGVTPALYKLSRNHRSVPEIVRFANRIQSLMIDAVPNKMVSYRGEQGEKGSTSILTGENPEAIANIIVRDIQAAGKPYRDYCLLMRAGSQLRDIEGAFIKARIPYVVRGGRSLLQTEEVRDILTYVRFATNPKDYAALMRASAQMKGVGPAKVETIRKVAEAEHGGDLYLACKAAGMLMAGFINTIDMVRRSIDDPIAAVNAAITNSGYSAYLKRKYARDQERVETKLDNLLRLKDMVRGLTEESEMTTEDLIFQMTMEKPEKESPEGCVTISTVHSAKGLEWSVIYLLNVVEGSLPSKFATSADDIAEERRVWYVGATRARDKLVVCVPDNMMQGQYMSPCKPSRFLVELGLFPPQN